jgi:hypothetical protein
LAMLNDIGDSRTHRFQPLITGPEGEGPFSSGVLLHKGELAAFDLVKEDEGRV